MKRKLYSTLVLILGFACTFTFFAASQNSIEKTNDKMAVLRGHSHDRAPANFNKTRAPIYTSVVRIDDGSNPELLRLKGTVTARRDFENLKIQWALPAGVEAVSGSVETSVSLAAGESQSFELLIATKTQQNRQVYFHAQTVDQGEGRELGSASQYNTTKQEEIAQQLKENYIKAKEQVRSGELRKIIF